MSETAWIGVGSNLSDRVKQVNQAKALLKQQVGIELKREAALYETDPEGHAQGPRFINTVWEIETDLSPQQLLHVLHGIELKLGRVRKERNEPRTIDLDILFFDHLIIQTDGLTVPHPRLQQRWFVLKPLSDLCADLKHPISHQTVQEMLELVGQPQ